MQLGCCITTLVLCGATAFARIGETDTQIEKRYGQATGGSGSSKAYAYKDFFVIVTFDNGISGIETFQKRNDSPMARLEIEKLLETNTDGSRWERSARNDFLILYTSKTRFAEYNAIINTLTIADDAAVRRISVRNRSIGAKP